MTLSEDSFSAVFTNALQGRPCAVVGLDDAPTILPIGDWTREADDDDHSLLSLCVGPTIDVGCGPGRLSAALAGSGRVVLGIDVVHEAIDLTRQRGASALRRDIFQSVPGEGRWHTALLADGNVGIGGNPVALLRRVREILDPRGRIVAELAGPGVPMRSVWAALECEGTRSRPFRWSVVGIDDIDDLAAQVGLAVTERQQHGARWSVVLGEVL